MRKRPDKLTHTFVKNVTEPGRYGERRGGLGLSILVKQAKSGRWSKSWSQNFRIHGKPTSVGLGSFPVVTLAMARERALENARRLANGEDIRQATKIIPTFAQAFDDVLATRARHWRGAASTNQWLVTRRLSAPLHAKPVSSITSLDVRQIIKSLCLDKPSVAQRFRMHVSMVMDWAIGEGHRTDNPAGPQIMRSLSKPPPPTHQMSMRYADVGAALATVRDADVWWAEKDCFLFMALTCARSVEARLATWEEIYLADSTWTVPAARMKGGLVHKVPLSTQAKAILTHAREQSGQSAGLIFRSERRNAGMDGGRLSAIMRKLDLPMVPHGLRSSFRNWAGSLRSIADPAAEMCLAHRPSEAVRKAYLTEDFFELREPVMQDWADFLTQSMGPIISTMPT